jgi:hypothetical protein
MISAAQIPFRTNAPDVLTSKRAFTVVAEGAYRLDVPDLGIEFHATHCRRAFGALVADVTVRTSLAGAKTIDGLLASECMDLSRRGDRSRLSAFLAQRSGAKDLDWVGLVELLCVSVLEADRVGDPIVWLSDVEPKAADLDWQIDGLPPLSRSLPMLWFADGGSAKSLLALYAMGELAKRGVRSLYLDWELTQDEHKARLRELYGEDEPAGIGHMRAVGSLVDELPRISQWCAKERPDYLVVDSVVPALGGKAESAEEAARFFRALRSLGVGSLSLAHITKSQTDRGDQANEDKPFGSVFFSNLARSCWLLKKNTESEDKSWIEVAFFHKKVNIGKKLSARGVHIDFELGPPSRTHVRPFDVASNDELASRLPLWQRLRRELLRGPQTLETLEETLGTSDAQIKKALRQQRGLFLLDGQSVMLRASVPDDTERF